MAIATETMGSRDSTSLDEDGGDPSECGCNERNENPLTVDTPVGRDYIQNRSPRPNSRFREMRHRPAELAERSRERIRAMIQRLLASYICCTRGITSEPTKPPPSTELTAAELRDPVPLDVSPTDPLKLDGQQSQDLDVTMAESTVTFGNTMCLNDLDGGAVTSPPCAASVPIPVKLAKSIEEELKGSSGVIEDFETGASGWTIRPAPSMCDLCNPVPDGTLSRSCCSRPDFTRNNRTLRNSLFLMEVSSDSLVGHTHSFSCDNDAQSLVVDFLVSLAGSFRHGSHQLSPSRTNTK